MTQTMAVTRHPPIRDQVANILRTAIVNLEFAPGQLLIERNLCELTGASRPSVREALRQLEAEGLVESHNGRGTFVRVVTAAEAHDVYEVRAELEGLAARLFTERASESERQRIRDAIADLQAATDADIATGAILAAQTNFYSALFDGAHNEFLVRTIQGMQTRVAQLRALTLAVPGRARASLEEFVGLGRLLLEGDGPAAEQAAIEHVQNAGKAMASVAPATTNGR